MNRAIYKLEIDCGRHGGLQGVFVAKKEQIRYLIDNKIKIYFGEVLGKHSNVVAIIEENEIEEVTDNEDFIKLFESYGLWSGFNPLDYHSSMEEDGETFDDQWKQYLFNNL